jgi:integrase
LAAAHFAEAFRILGGDHIVAAARLYLEKNPAALPSKPVPQLVEELLAHKKARGASPRYVEDLRSRLGRFGEAFKVPVASVTAASVQGYLDKLKASPQTVLNTRRVLSLLFSFAVARGLLRKADNPMEHVEKVAVRSSGSVEIFKPSEVAKLLQAAPENFKPCLALAAFAGLRSAELERLSWADIDLQRGFVTVAAHKSKTGSRRLVPIALNLKAWLASYADQSGPVWGGNHKGFYDAQQAAAEAAGVKWKANALRHSFASYRLAEVQSAAQVALELGNSPAVVFKHYRELCSPAEASTWFNVLPEAPANVTPLQAEVG